MLTVALRGPVLAVQKSISPERSITSFFATDGYCRRSQVDTACFTRAPAFDLFPATDEAIACTSETDDNVVGLISALCVHACRSSSLTGLMGCW